MNHPFSHGAGINREFGDHPDMEDDPEAVEAIGEEAEEGDQEEESVDIAEKEEKSGSEKRTPKKVSRCPGK